MDDNTIKLVNVYPNSTIKLGGMIISGPLYKVKMTISQINTCINSKAIVDEVLNDGSVIRLNLINYDNNNGGVVEVPETGPKSIVSSSAASVSNYLNDTDLFPGAISGNAIKSYIASKISSIDHDISDLSYNSATKTISFKEAGVSKSIPITGFLTGAIYNALTSTLTIGVAGGSNINITFPADNFVSSGEYDEDNKKIILTLKNGNKVEIPADHLVTDLSDKLNKVATYKTDELIIANEDGSIKTSGVKIGGSSLSSTPSANTIVNEEVLVNTISWIIE